ncbi:MAG: hypothetical protein QOG40_1575 [Solirubrobacteraceae bacterium]|nr:hypothetical protein [Solirubrobacteraceae bacterium]
MYHLELRKFPHTVCRFNQSEQQLRAVIVPWTSEQWIEEGERKWNSNEATITVLEGPELSMPDLAMGRGWRNAQRRSQDVTERVLEAVKREKAAARSAGERGPDAAAGVDEAAPGSQLVADSLALELLGLLDAGPALLSRAWALASQRLGDASAADSLALAEQAVRSLVARGLVVLATGGDAGATDVHSEPLEARLRAVDSWGDSEAGSLWIARRV